MEEEQKTPKPKGGARPGAGRKPKGGVGTEHVGVRLNKEYIQIIKENYDNFSTFVDKAVKNQLIREGLI
jgi:hypothetical protein